MSLWIVMRFKMRGFVCSFLGVLFLSELITGHVCAQPPAKAAIEKQASSESGRGTNGTRSEGFNLDDSDFQWRLRVAMTALQERLIRRLSGERETIIPQLRPVAANGYVFMRSTEHMFAVKLDSGKRVFNYPWMSPEKRVPLSVEDESNWLRQRVWGDTGYGRLTTDGNLVYGINAASREPRQIFALEIVSEGRLKWRLGGVDSTEPRLENVSFLGPPIPFDGVVYAIATTGLDQILVAIEPDSGALKWSTDIGKANTKRLRIDGAHPRIANGIAICPASVAKFVAVDIATRKTKWTYQCDESGNSKPGWLDTQVELVGDHVLATNRSRSKLYAIDLSSGELKWKREERNGLYVQAIDADSAIIVGSKSASLIDVADGNVRWGKKVEFAATPSGRGVVMNDSYFVPLADGQVLQIDLQTGKVSRRIKRKKALGNLIVAEGYLISNGAEFLEAFKLPAK